MGTAINTAKAERRALRFNSIDDLLKEMDRIVAAERSGKLRCTGNWSAGTTFNHLATWIDYGYDGFPAIVNPPFFIRWILTLRKGKYIRKGANPGVHIPGIPGGTLGTEPCDTDQGAAALRAALLKLKNRQPVKHHSPAFGPMTDDEREQFQLRHAELHLGFLHP